MNNHLTSKINPASIRIETFSHEILQAKHLSLDILRLDEIHPIISGNKLFKLKYYLEDALQKKCHTIQTFGGFYSNHIVATAYAAQLCQLKSIGIIRGAKSDHLTPTLQEAETHGMTLRFVSASDYQTLKRNQGFFDNVYSIPEGGYGLLGAKGAAEILSFTNRSYDYIVCAVGTGTMVAGIINASADHQQIIGISALKGAYSLETEINKLLNSDKKNYQINHDYHFGGFAKHPSELLAFMELTWKENRLPTDVVYTSKTLYAILDLAQKKHFKLGSQMLMIHSGGLQGNRSLSLKLCSSQYPV